MPDTCSGELGSKQVFREGLGSPGGYQCGQELATCPCGKVLAALRAAIRLKKPIFTL